MPGQTQYQYQFEGMSPGEYSAIAVGWEHPNENLPREQRVAPLGVYWSDTDSVSTGLTIPPFLADPLPDSFTLNKGDNITTYDIAADFIYLNFFN